MLEPEKASSQKPAETKNDELAKFQTSATTENQMSESELRLSSMPRALDEVQWLIETTRHLRDAGYEGPFESQEQAFEAAGRAIRTCDDAGLTRLLCDKLGEGLPREQGINTLFRLITEPSDVEFTRGHEFQIVVDDYRVFYAAMALVDASQPRSRWAQHADTRLSTEDARLIRDELKALARDKSLPDSVTGAVNEALTLDKERTNFMRLLRVPLIAMLYGKYLEFKRFRQGRERRYLKDYTDNDRCNYRQAWVSVSGDKKYDNPDEILIDTPRPSGLMEVNRQRGTNG